MHASSEPRRLMADAPQPQPRKPHALFIAYPLQGHLIPCVHLALNLASKGFTITFVNTHAAHHQLSHASNNPTTTSHDDGDADDIFAGARRSGLDIRYTTISDGLPVEVDRSLNHEQFMAALLHAMSAHVEELVGKMMRMRPAIDCLITDTFFAWPSTIASRFGLIYVSLWTETALVFSLYHHLHLLCTHRHFASVDNRKDPIDYIPGVASIDPSDLPSYLQETDISTTVHQIIFKSFAQAKGAHFVLCNTVHELEPHTIAALQTNKPFYAIGPINLSLSSHYHSSSNSCSFWPESDCNKWLDSKPPGSVLYVSFGSYAHVSKRDLEELAMGVLHTHVNFIWVLRPDIVSSDADDPLPIGFEKECGERGMIVPWCAQMPVLSHPSVGAFLTHCGWNSTLESAWCGVPMLCFPLLTDQFTNRKLIVDDWKIGIDLQGGRDRRKGEKITREVVSMKIKSVMGTGSGLGDDLRKRIKEVRRIVQNAMLDPNASSEKNIQLFIKDLKDKIQQGHAWELPTTQDVSLARKSC